MIAKLLHHCLARLGVKKCKVPPAQPSLLFVICQFEVCSISGWHRLHLGQAGCCVWRHLRLPSKLLHQGGYLHQGAFTKVGGLQAPLFFGGSLTSQGDSILASGSPCVARLGNDTRKGRRKPFTIVVCGLGTVSGLAPAVLALPRYIVWQYCVMFIPTHIRN